MGITELLNSLVIIGIELHAAFLALVVFLFENMRRSYKRNSKKPKWSLILVYVGSVLMIISDCVWSTVDSLGNPGTVAAYVINIVYFVSSTTAAASWFVFCACHLEKGLTAGKKFYVLSLLPWAAAMVLYLLSPFFGTIFSVSNGEYSRGSLFYLDPVIKMGYICLASAMASVYGSRKKLGYQKRKDYNYALFGLPVLACGVLQIITGVDFNCLGVSSGLALIYVTGITNQDSENTDAIYSLANSFEASYIVNINTGFIRPLHRDTMHDKDMPGMESSDYTSHFYGVLSEILLPEDRSATLEAFAIENVTKRFEFDNAFSIRYRVREKSGLSAIHTASFILANGEDGRREFLLGINTIHTDSLLYERSETLRHENRRLEQINTGIIESVAKIVEARDRDSGEHIVRVKKLTEILARGLSAEYPELGLDENAVRLISSASVLHDIGKIVIPDAILLKQDRLSEGEFDKMKTHTTRGCEILNSFPLGLDDAFLECALSICRWHHEKNDGSGYPDGLSGDDIPVAAQIVSVADCFDALVSNRPYKEAFSPEKAFDMIVGGECGAFSPKIIETMKKQRSKLLELARLYS